MKRTAWYSLAIIGVALLVGLRFFLQSEDSRTDRAYVVLSASGDSVEIRQSSGERILRIHGIPPSLRSAVVDLKVIADVKVQNISISNVDLGWLDRHFLVVIGERKFWILGFRWIPGPDKPKNLQLDDIEYTDGELIQSD